jgi:hypothetical protein
MEKVSRPMWGAQIAAVAFAVLVATGFGAYMLREGVVQGTLQGSLKTAMAGFGLAPMIAIGLLLVLAGGVVVYLTLEGE